jgi:hypothetical protein
MQETQGRLTKHLAQKWTWFVIGFGVQSCGHIERILVCGSKISTSGSGAGLNGLPGQIPVTGLVAPVVIKDTSERRVTRPHVRQRNGVDRSMTAMSSTQSWP